MRKLLKRRWLWGPLLLAAVVGTGYLGIPVNETGVSRPNFDRIQNGWTEEQVEEQLGGRASSHAVNGELRSTLPGATTSLWWGDESDLIVVVFDEGLVTDKAFTASLLTPWERVKRRVARGFRAAWPGS